MYTQIDKRQENRKPSVTTAPARMHERAQNKISQADARFASFQKMASNSPGSQKALQLQTLANHYAATLPVVQRKPLAHDKLNVAGEFHNESNPRRVDEAAYSTEMTAGGYWTESQFAIGGKAADDFELRAKNLIAYAKKADLGKWLKFETQALITALQKGFLNTSDLKLTLSLFRPDELEYYKPHISKKVYDTYDETLINKGHLLKSIENIDDALPLYNPMNRDSVELLHEAVGTFQLIFSVTAMQINELVQDLEIGSTTSMAQERSVAMHQGANLGAARLGVWKVGDSHATDMQTMAGKNYELFTCSEFNDGFKLFKAQRTALAQITAIANGNWKPYTKGLPSRPKGVSAIVDILQGPGNIPTRLANVKVRAQQDYARASNNRHPKAQAFYAALNGMNVNNKASMKGIPALMTAINL